jgi:hypothetical protein
MQWKAVVRWIVVAALCENMKEKNAKQFSLAGIIRFEL